MPQADTVMAHCNTCGGDRNHSVLHRESSIWEDEGSGASGKDAYEMLRCMGCDSITFRHLSWDDTDPEPAIHYFPPAIFRQKPAWLNGWWIDDSYDEVVAGLLDEIYSALQNNAPRLAAMGVRSLIEHIMISKVGDQGSFVGNLAKFEAEGYVSRVQRTRLETILEAGHATTHRKFKPSRFDLITLVDIAQSIVETIYVHEGQVAALRKRVPPRDKKK
jgi:hypothetical protein